MTDRKPKPRALVVDDEPDIRELLSITLGRMDIEVATAADRTEALRRLGGERFDLVLTDMRLPDGDGLDVVEWLQEHRPGVPVAVITAHGNVEAAVRALKLGAFDFISKPLDLAALRKLVAATLKLDREQGRELPDPGLPAPSAAAIKLLGQSRAMQQLRQMIAKIAPTNSRILISGPPGSGKELVARMIHVGSQRAGSEFVPIAA
ncbi:MAG: sigma-54-dependent transcriptional regulator, partial [Steroidobacteraceae bacterium]